eukprot:6201532-Pleurochrysis_carterae.AAC.1
MGGVGVVGVRTRASVSAKDRVSACLAMRVCRLVQLGKASTVGVIHVAETIDERAHKHVHGSVDIDCRNLSLHVLQK